jgi:hypothetical protein
MNLGHSWEICKKCKEVKGVVQKWMLTIIHWTEHKVLNEGAREMTQGAEGV